MELLEEHLERLKADLDHKHAEVNEVEHSGRKQSEAALPQGEVRGGGPEEATLADLARRLKAHIREPATRGGQLPRLLLQSCEPMEPAAPEHPRPLWGFAIL